jgi:hypothetical protein
MEFNETQNLANAFLDNMRCPDAKTFKPKAGATRWLRDIGTVTLEEKDRYA